MQVLLSQLGVKEALVRPPKQSVAYPCRQRIRGALFCRRVAARPEPTGPASAGFVRSGGHFKPQYVPQIGCLSPHEPSASTRPCPARHRRILRAPRRPVSCVRRLQSELRLRAHVAAQPDLIACGCVGQLYPPVIPVGTCISIPRRGSSMPRADNVLGGSGN